MAGAEREAVGPSGTPGVTSAVTLSLLVSLLPVAGSDGLCVILKGRAQAPEQPTEGDASAASLVPGSPHSLVARDDAGNTAAAQLCPPPRAPQVRSACGRPRRFHSLLSLRAPKGPLPRPSSFRETVARSAGSPSTLGSGALVASNRPLCRGPLRPLGQTGQPTKR